MNLVIVEDNELVRYQLMRLIARRAEIHVAGVAANEEDAVSVILAAQPDAVLLDLSLASGSGVNVLRRIRAAGSPARVLVLTNHSVDIMRRTCESLGIDGFYDKSHDAQACLEHLYSWLPARGEGLR